MELNKIYNEDCLVTLSKMEDNSVDLVVTSPPYNKNHWIKNKVRSKDDFIRKIEYSTYVIARNFKVSKWNVEEIVKRKTWTHI